MFYFPINYRITALVLLALALEQWVVIVLFVHWLGMTLWVVYQARTHLNIQLRSLIG